MENLPKLLNFCKFAVTTIDVNHEDEKSNKKYFNCSRSNYYVFDWFDDWHVYEKPRLSLIL